MRAIEPYGAPNSVPAAGSGERDLLIERALRRRGAPASEAQHYLRVLWRRRWLIVGSTLLGLAVSAIVTLRQPRLYEATATVEFRQPLPPGKDLDRSESQVFVPAPLAVRLLTTKVLATRAIGTLREKGYGWFSDPPPAEEAGMLASVLALPAAVLRRLRLVFAAPPPDQKQAVSTALADPEGADLPSIGRYYSHFGIKPVPLTSLVDISVLHEDPRVAATLANEHARLFIEMDAETKLASLNDATSLFYQQLKEVKGKFESSRQALTDYQREHGILSLPEDNTTITRESLEQLNTLLTKAQGERIVAEADFRHASSLTAEELAQSLPDEGLQTLRQELLGLEARYEANAKEYGHKHPDMVTLRARIEALRDRLRSAGLQARQQRAARLEIAQAKERELRANVEEHSKAATQEDRELVQFLILQRDVDSNRDLYNSLLQQAKTADLNSGAFRWTSVKLVDRAAVPAVPSLPTTRRNLGLGLLLGLAGGVLAAVALDRFDRRIHRADQVLEELQLPVFGVVPDFRSVLMRPLAQPGVRGADSKELVMLAHPSSLVSEAYRGIRTNLLFACPGRPPRTVLVTSSQPGEGKTVTTVNLAVSLALAGSKVLIIDADVRKPGCHERLRVAREPGLSNVLAGQCGLAEALVRAPLFNMNGENPSAGAPELFVLPAGVSAPNPAELLASSVMSGLLDELQERFEFVLVDSPPVLAVTDSVVLSTKTDGVLMVVRSGAWGRDVVSTALTQLDAVGANVLGVVLNCVDVSRRDSSHYYYSRYYGAYYGKGSEADSHSS